MVYIRPGMYVGDIDDHALERLEAMIFGFAYATEHHHVKDAGVEVYDLFPSHLEATFGWSMARGPVKAIADRCNSSREAWGRFWELFWAFVETRLGNGAGL